MVKQKLEQGLKGIPEKTPGAIPAEEPQKVEQGLKEGADTTMQKEEAARKLTDPVKPITTTNSVLTPDTNEDDIVDEKGIEKGNPSPYTDTLYKNIASNVPDTMTKAKEYGKEAQENIENVTPRYSPVSWSDIIKDPAYSGKRGEMILDSLFGSLGAAAKGETQRTAKNTINEPIIEQYGQNIAERDRRGMETNVQDIEAANKQKMGLELNLADTVAGQYIKRFEAAETEETKRQLLEQMVKDSETWAGLDYGQKIDVLSYLKAVDGDGTIWDMLTQEYGDDVLSGINKLYNKIMGNEGSGEEDPVFNIGGANYKGSELKKMYDSNYESVNKMIAGIVDKDGNPDYEAQQDIINDLAKRWNVKTNKLQKSLNEREANANNQAAVNAAEDNARAKRDANRATAWIANFNDTIEEALDWSKKASYKSRIKALDGAIATYENELARDYGTTDFDNLMNGKIDGLSVPQNEKDAYVNVKNVRERLKDGEEASSFDNTVSSVIGAKKKTPGQILKELTELKSDYSPSQLKETKGFSDIVKYLKSIRNDIKGTSYETLYDWYVDNPNGLQAKYGLTKDEITSLGLQTIGS